MQSDNTNHPNGNGSSEIQEKINEAELYVTQGLFEEARQIYQQILNDLLPLAKKAAADPASRQSYESRRTFIQEQLAIIDRQEADFLGHFAGGRQICGDDLLGDHTTPAQAITTTDC